MSGYIEVEFNADDGGGRWKMAAIVVLLWFANKQGHGLK